MQFLYLICGVVFAGVIFGIVFAGMISPGYGHGLGGETLPPVTIGDRNATISVNIDPPIFDPDIGEQRMEIRFFDADTDAVIEHVTYMIELKKDGKQIFRNIFHDDLGNLILKIKSVNSDRITITGKQENLLGGWMKDGINPVTIEGQIFQTGGLYQFKVEILTLDEDKKVLDERVIFNGAISVADKSYHEVVGSDGNNHNLQVTSWYDNIYDFQYDSNVKKIAFRMPFDWSQANIEQVNIIHEEIHIPKNFPDMLVTKYDVMVNGIPLPENSVVPDDYSNEDRTVHIIIPKKELFSIRDSLSESTLSEMSFEISPNKQVVLPMTTRTTDVQYQVNLWWDPPIIKSNQSIRFFVDISELFVINKEEKPISYDFVLKKGEDEISRHTVKAQVNAEPKTYFQDIVFTRNQTGTISVFIEKINGGFLSNANFLIVVEPQSESKQMFPIRISSIKPNEDLDSGSYFIDLTWTPSPIEIFQESEFIITIYDKKTNKPVPNSNYEFVVLSDTGEEILRRGGFTKSGGTFENYRFVGKDLGNAILRIEKINDSDEFVEVNIKITPEFPTGAFLVFFITVISFVLFSKTMKIRLLTK